MNPTMKEYKQEMPSIITEGNQPLIDQIEAFQAKQHQDIIDIRARQCVALERIATALEVANEQKINA